MPPMIPNWHRVEEWLWRTDPLRRLLDMAPAHGEDAAPAIALLIDIAWLLSALVARSNVRRDIALRPRPARHQDWVAAARPSWT
jgi:hypothetical protein